MRWPLFALLVAAVVVVLGWLSEKMLDLERKETDAIAERNYHRNLRFARERVERRAAVILSIEAARPSAEYAPFYSLKQQTYTRDLQKIDSEEVLAQSPLLTSKPQYVRLHFQFREGGDITSPQVPRGNFREIAEQTLGDDLATHEHVLAKIRLLNLRDVVTKLERAEAQVAAMPSVGQWTEQVANSKRGNVLSQKGVAPSATGPLEGVWVGDDLLFLRRLSKTTYQGFLADWGVLRTELLAEVADLVPGATLTPTHDSDERLLTMPLLFVAPRPDDLAAAQWTATHTTLAVTWATVLGAVVAMGWALRRSILFGEKQRRFASLVTHELRSPLTTFRLYADLLAERLVVDKDKRETYYRTLQKESDHMARMVENVIAHSRLEEGRTEFRRTPVLLGTLLDEAAADLRACAEKAGLELRIDAGAAAEVPIETDAGAVGQILGNLVENACKYGRSPIEIDCAAHAGTARISVRDHGPGVPDAVRQRIFRPFDRGQRDEAAPVRGLGLGLALSRGLARDLGGDLTLETPPDGGARFVIALPAT